MYSKLIKCAKLVHFIGFIPSISRNLSLFFTSFETTY